MSASVVDLRVEARLWQDPFEAVDTHIKIEESAKKGGSEQGPIAHSHQLKDVTAELVDSFPLPIHVHVLTVLADGSPHAESRETRLRQRFAVLSGLEQAGYTPVDSEHIRFFHWPDETFCQGTSSDQQGKTSLQMYWSSSTKDVKTSISASLKSSCSPAHGQAGKYEYWRQAPVPVEWYRSKKTALDEDVLVFWIKDQDLGNRPTESLRAIQRTVMNAFPPFRPTVSFKVIGPRFSGTLQAMIGEIGMTEKAESQDALLIYSPWSTAPEGFLTGDDQSVAKHLEKVKTIFTRTIPTDKELIDALFDELERRGVALECKSGETCNHIAVISEWDTLYGRMLPELVRGTISDGNNRKLIGFHQYSYLRGLDGELPQTKAKNNSEPSSPDTTPSILSPKDRQQDVTRMERPEGRSQLDYIRQLAELIREKENRIQTECGLWKWNRCPGFRAIGVLGSDVYDKLLIMQALKKSFPHVIFFTTDLDARLFHPSELAWTRNLVVASHFDLMLHEQLQGTIPQFRDTYQTATFFTVLRALGVLKESTSLQKQSSFGNNTTLTFQPSGREPQTFEPVPRTKLHEIGRNGPVDISVPDSDNQRRDLEAINTVRPAPVNLSKTLTNCAYVVAVLLLVWILLLPASVMIAKCSALLLTKSASSPAQTMIGLVVFASLLAMILRYLISDSYEGEPFSLLDGVSIWPSQLLRGAVIGLSVLFGWLLYQHSDRTCNQMEKQFPEILKPETPPSNLSSSLMDTIQQVWKAPDQILIDTWTPDKDAPISMRWAEYKKRLHWTWILMRVTPVSFAFWVVGQIVLGITGFPFTPSRGEVAWQVNLILLLPSVLGMIGIIFYVLDVTQLASAFIEKLVPETTEEEDSTITFPHIQIIEQLTDRIDKFIYFPAALLVLMVIARSEFIDNWDFPI
ncbi:MAG: hypothetical protein E8D52_11335 [Nitrospira sp.]|nr:MAG: hypothetical protein E8D52_11335 [Nitrospira sp.]